MVVTVALTQYFEAFWTLSRKLAAGYLLTAGLSACAAVDAFGPRVDTYNDQAANSKASMILKNVIRAANHLPLQFSDVSSVSGTASSSIQLGASVPIVSPATILSPQGSMSGGPTFTFANLNTQEFYNGIQTPISFGVVMTLLKSGGISPYILYPLVISDVELSDGKVRHVWHSGSSQESFQTFTQLLNGYISAGLNVEAVDDTQVIGPELSTAAAMDPEIIARIGSSLVATADTKVTLQKVPGREANSGDRFALVRKGSRIRICFDPFNLNLYKAYQDKRPDEDIGPAKVHQPVHVHFKEGYGLADVVLNTGHWCGQNDMLPKKKGLGYLSFSTRSVEGIIHYLGDLTRTELGLENGIPTALGIPAYHGGDPVSIFKVTAGQRHPDDIITLFNGQVYSIAVDASGRDYSSQAIQLLTDLIALESSAKNFPAPSVVTLVP